MTVYITEAGTSISVTEDKINILNSEGETQIPVKVVDEVCISSRKIFSKRRVLCSDGIYVMIKKYNCSGHSDLK